jgi:hypothetical protein
MMGSFEIFHPLTPPGHTMVLGLTQPIAEISIRNLPQELKAASVSCHLHVPNVKILETSISWSPWGLSRPLQGQFNIAFLLTINKT